MGRRARERSRFGPRLTAASMVLLGCFAVPLLSASAQDAADKAWQPAAIAHAQAMRSFPDASSGEQQTPALIPELGTDVDPTGLVATFQPDGKTPTSGNAFFQDLGTNGRTCFTCHQPQTGWT